jgi:hypothetical protein
MVARPTMTPFVTLLLDGAAERVVLRNEDGPFGPGTVPRTYVAVSGEAGGQASIDCWDTHDPYNIQLISRTPCSGKAVDVTFAGPWLAVAELEGGCELFSLGVTGARPRGYLPGNALRVLAGGDRLLIAGGNRGLVAASGLDCLQ